MKTKLVVLLVVLFFVSSKVSYACVETEDQANQNIADYNAQVDQINQDNAASSAAGAQVAADKKAIVNNQAQLAIYQPIVSEWGSYEDDTSILGIATMNNLMKGTSYYVEPGDTFDTHMPDPIVVINNFEEYENYLQAQVISLQNIISNAQADELIQSAKEPDTSEQVDQVPLPDSTVCVTPNPVLTPPVASNTPDVPVTDSLIAPVIQPTPDTKIYPYQQKIIDSVKVDPSSEVFPVATSASTASIPIVNTTMLQSVQDKQTTPVKPSWIENIFLVIKSWF
jgi:hypothetical protein